MYGPAVRRKRFRRPGGFAVLHQCIRPLIGAVCAPRHHGYQRGCVCAHSWRRGGPAEGIIWWRRSAPSSNALSPCWPPRARTV